MEEYKIVCPIAGKIVASEEGLWRMQWSDRNHMDLLYEIDFLRTVNFLERSEATWHLAGAWIELFESLH